MSAAGWLLVEGSRVYGYFTALLEGCRNGGGDRIRTYGTLAPLEKLGVLRDLNRRIKPLCHTSISCPDRLETGSVGISCRFRSLRKPKPVFVTNKTLVPQFGQVGRYAVDSDDLVLLGELVDDPLPRDPAFGP